MAPTFEPLGQIGTCLRMMGPLGLMRPLSSMIALGPTEPVMGPIKPMSAMVPLGPTEPPIHSV